MSLVAGLLAAANLIHSPRRASASNAPSTVTEFQPTLHATNPGAPKDFATYGGRSLAVEIDPANASTAIVATESGGLFRSTDGVNWSHISSLVPFRMSDVKWSPTDTNTVIATTWQTADSANPGGIYRSIDGGVTWTRPASANSFCGGNYFAWGLAAESGSKNVYAGTDCGIAVSTDSGATWSLTSTPRVHAIVAQSGGTVDTCADDGHHRYTNNNGTLTQVGSTSLIAGGGCVFSGQGASVHDLAASPLESNVLFSMQSAQTTTQCGATVAKPRTPYFLEESDDAGANWTALGPACAPTRPPWVATHVASNGNANQFDLYFTDGRDLYHTTCNKGGTGSRCTNIPSSSNSTTGHADLQGMAWPPGSNCPEYLASDGGLQKTTDCGASFDMAAGSGSGNGGFNALQINDIVGQALSDHSDFYFGTQDNSGWASGNAGQTWPNAACCDTFGFQTPSQAQTDTGQRVTFTSCVGCINLQAPAQLANCNFNPACSGWTNPSGTLPGQGEDTSPMLLPSSPNSYVEWSVPSGQTANQLYLTTNAGSMWNAINGATITQGLLSRPIVVGSSSSPVVYQPYCASSCGFFGPAGQLKKITGILGSTATVSDADTGLGQLGTYNDGNLGFMHNEPALGVDPSNPNNLFAADVTDNVMKVSTTGGTSWTSNQQLTNLVTEGGQLAFSVPNIGSQAHAISVDPNATQHIFVGTESAGIIASYDGGTTWVKMVGSEQATAVTGFYFDAQGRGNLISTYGRGLWKLDTTSRAATFTYTGPASADFDDPVTLSGKLYDTAAGPSAPLAFQAVTLQVGSQSCPAVTDINGNASCTITLNQPAGAVQAVVTWSGAGPYGLTSAGTPFTVNHEETTTTYTGDTGLIANGRSAHLSGVLKEDGVTPISGRTVIFTLGTGATAQSCNGTPTTATGFSQCTINPVQQPLGPETATARFPGDTFYQPSSSSGRVTVYQPGGAFAVSVNGAVSYPRTPNVVCPPGGSATVLSLTITSVGTLNQLNASCSTNPTDGTTAPATSVSTARLFGGALVIQGVQSGCTAGPAGISCTSSVGSVNGMPIGTAAVTLTVSGVGLVVLNEAASNGPGRPVRNAVHIKTPLEDIVLAESYFN